MLSIRDVGVTAKRPFTKLGNMNFTLSDLLGVIGQGGWAAVPAILTFIIFTGFRGDWRSRREYLELVKDREEWKLAAKTAIQTSREQQEQITKLTSIVEALTNAVALRGARA